MICHSFLFVHEDKGNTLVVSTQNHSDHQSAYRVLQSISRFSSKRAAPMHGDHLRSSTIMQGYWRKCHRTPIKYLCPTFSWNSFKLSPYSALFVSRLASYEVLLLSTPNITLAWCNILNPATLLPSLQDKDDHDCVLLTDYLLTLIDNADLIWFTDGSSLRDELGHYCAGYAITSSADVIENSCLPGIKTAEQAELIALTWVCHLFKDLTEKNMYS